MSSDQKCKKCGWNYSMEPFNQTTDNAHRLKMCTQCYVQSRVDIGDDRFRSGLFSGFFKSDK